MKAKKRNYTLHWKLMEPYNFFIVVATGPGISGIKRELRRAFTKPEGSDEPMLDEYFDGAGIDPSKMHTMDGRCVYDEKSDNIVIYCKNLWPPFPTLAHELYHAVRHAARNWHGRENCSLEELDGEDLIAIANQFEAAHRREVDKYKNKWHEAVTLAFDIDKLASIEKQTESLLKKNEIIAGLRLEVAKLRESLRVLSNAMVIVVQCLGKFPKWQEELKKLVSENRKALEGAAK